MLTGRFVALEPLTMDHLDEIADAVGADRSSYSWAPVPSSKSDTADMIELRLSQLAAGQWIPFVQRRLADGAVVGMTNFLSIERWNGADADPTSVEIGGTWLNPSAQRTPINTEAKLLLMAHAFDTWNVVRVQIKTDERNTQSRAAIERLGARFEGILRSFQPGYGDVGTGAPRSTAMYSVIAPEWPAVRTRLETGLASR
jgi:N-acetyltransferase